MKNNNQLTSVKIKYFNICNFFFRCENLISLCFDNCEKCVGRTQIAEKSSRHVRNVRTHKEI